MNKYIYIDNYRGFTDALVPIKDVNFLVGKNSTGKTSVLAILKLLSPPDFWLQNEFDLKEVSLGTFRDVVSISAEDKSYFSVGIVFDRPLSKKQQTRKLTEDNNTPIQSGLIALLLTFTEKEGMPKLASAVSYRNGLEIRIKYVGDSIRYKYSESVVEIGSEQFGRENMKEWVGIHKNDRTGYTILKEAGMFLRNAPPIVIMSFLEDQIIEKRPSKNRMEFELPSFFTDIAWLAPIRTKPRKTYDEFSLDFSPEGDHTPYLIKKSSTAPQIQSGFENLLMILVTRVACSRRFKSRIMGVAPPLHLNYSYSQKGLYLNYGLNILGKEVFHEIPEYCYRQSRHDW